MYLVHLEIAVQYLCPQLNVYDIYWNKLDFEVQTDTVYVPFKQTKILYSDLLKMVTGLELEGIVNNKLSIYLNIWTVVLTFKKKNILWSKSIWTVIIKQWCESWTCSVHKRRNHRDWVDWLVQENSIFSTQLHVCVCGCVFMLTDTWSTNSAVSCPTKSN